MQQTTLAQPEQTVLAAQHAARLLARADAIAQAAEEAIAELKAIEALGAGDDGGHWLEGVKEALERIRLDSADVRYGARGLREALPGPDAVQRRLL